MSCQGMTQIGYCQRMPTVVNAPRKEDKQTVRSTPRRCRRTDTSQWRGTMRTQQDHKHTQKGYHIAASSRRRLRCRRDSFPSTPTASSTAFSAASSKSSSSSQPVVAGVAAAAPLDDAETADLGAHASAARQSGSDKKYCTQLLYTQ
jgi:hypothetical protein